MRDIDDGLPELLVNLLEGDAQLDAKARVQVRQRLVQQQQLRRLDDGAADRGPLLLAAGEGPGQAV